MAELITAEYPSEWYYDDENRWISRDTSPEDGEIAMHFTHDGVPDDETMQLILDALNAEEEEDDPAVVKAFDKIAEACGCEEWDYPGQLVRDVEALAEDRDIVIAVLDSIGKQFGLHGPTPSHEIEKAVVDGVEQLRSANCTQGRELAGLSRLLGYPDGTFKPGALVESAESLVAQRNALVLRLKQLDGALE